MKNMYTKFIKGLGILGLFGLVLGAFLTPFYQTKAQVVLASVAITASPDTICAGESTQLSWSSTDANVTINQGIGSVNPYGNRTVTPSQTTTYTITGTNNTGGYASASATVYISGSCTQQTGRIEGYRVTGANNAAIAGSTIRVSGPTSTSSNASPYGFTLPVGSYTVSADNISGYTLVGYTLCVNSISCHNNNPSGGSSVHINVASGSSYDLWWHYEAIVVAQLPTVSLTADSSNINYGGNTTVRWTSNNATSCTANNGSNGWSGSKNLSGSFYTGSLNNSTTYNITCYNSAGQSATDSVTVNVGGQPQLPAVAMTVSPDTICAGQSTQLSWSSTNATTVTINQGIGSVQPYGNRTVTPSQNTTYTITGTNNTGVYASASATVYISTSGSCAQLPTVNLTADDASINYGSSTTLRWTSNNATSCTGTNFNTNNSTGGSVSTGSLNNSRTYNITCYNSAGQSATDSVTVVVENQQNDITVNISADDTNLNYDESTTVRWTSTNASYCTASGGSNSWSGNKNTNGTFYTGSLTSDKTYSIVCYNNAGVSRSDSVTVQVTDDNNNEGPDVTTRSATSINTANATLNGRVDGNGLTTRAWFEYGTNRNMYERTNERSYGSGSTTYDQYISGLQNNTTYYFRAVARNSEDTVYGSILSFNTGEDYIYYPPVQQYPTVVISADQTNLAYNSATTVRWYTTNASTCYASGGSFGWAGTKNIGPSSSYTGSLTSSKVYTITCTNSVGTATDSVTVNVRGQVYNNPTVRPIPTSYVLINTTVDRNQPIVPTIDNTRPHPGDEINYTINYQNIGTGAITNLNLRVDLPYEVDYMFSTPNNPTRSGQTLIFNLGTLKANGQGTVTIRVRVRDNVANGTNLNFPAVLSYTDPSGYPQSVNANVYAQVWDGPTQIINQNIDNTDNQDTNSTLGASVLGAGFLPSSIFEWLFLLILILILIILIKHVFSQSNNQPTAQH